MWVLNERLNCKSMEIKWYKYMKVDPELRSLWVISTISETCEGSADASETGQYAGSGSRLQKR